MRSEVILALVALAAWLLLTWYCLSRSPARRATPAAQATAPGRGIAIVYASQTGTAIELAQRTADAFDGRAALLPMDGITPAQLGGFTHALFIVSTYGEGDPPDMAHAFHGHMARDDTALQGLQAGILALGDSSYRHFCGFGMALDAWLRERGATLMFDTLKADRTDPAMLSAWADRLSGLFQVRLDTDLPFYPWTLEQRSVTNPEGLGQPCHELLWRPAGYTRLADPAKPVAAPDPAHPAGAAEAADAAAADPAGPGTPAPPWSAGDVVQIRIGDSGEQREYSIASVPSEGVLRLLVREHLRPDGSPGVGSGWLASGLAVGQAAQLRIRANPLFHAPDDGRPAVFIGNGTGIAGLRALLQERVRRGHHDNWLIFGERSRAGDLHWGELLGDWKRQGQLRKLDLAFSRDQAEKRYVHHLLSESAAEVLAWAGRGAVFYVCGSKDGMAQDVDHALRDILGPHGYEAMLQRQGYRRDVY